MFTRSGKRLHSLGHETGLEDTLRLEIEKKYTKHLKGKCEIIVTDKKRKNYVTHPSEEDIEFADNNYENTLTVLQKSNNMLRAQNVLATKFETTNDVKKSTQHNNTTRMKVDDNIELSDVQKQFKKPKKSKNPKIFEKGNENIDPIQQTITTARKKSNRKKNKKKINSTITVTSNINKSDVSLDSYHSAAGSLIIDKCDEKHIDNNIQIKDCESYTQFNKSLEQDFKGKATYDKFTNSPSNSCLFISNGNQPMSECINNTNIIQNKINNISPKEECINSVNKSLKVSHNFENVSKTKSKIRSINDNKGNNERDLNATFEMESTNVNLSCTVQKPEGTATDCEASSGNMFLNRKKSKTDQFSNINKPSTNQLNTTFNKEEQSDYQFGAQHNISTILNDDNTKKKRKSSLKIINYDHNDNLGITLDATIKKKSSKLIYQTDEVREEFLNISKMIESRKPYRSSRTDHTDIIDASSNILDGTLKKHTPTNINNSKFDKSAKNFNNYVKLDSTFDKFQTHDIQTRSSIISSDTSDNISSDKSEDNSHISITSDDSESDNINTTPFIIENRMNDSQMKIKQDNGKHFTSDEGNELASASGPKNRNTNNAQFKREGTYTEIQVPTPPTCERTDIESDTANMSLKHENGTDDPHSAEPSIKMVPASKSSMTPLKCCKTFNECKPTETPLKREGTFTKEDSDVIHMPNNRDRRRSLPSPGCTPFPTNKRSSKKSVLNVTRSIEKSPRQSPIGLMPRVTKVMFCSPVNNTMVVSQQKGKVIKSNLKGSNKSFLFNESVSEPSARSPRKRSRTQDEGARAKRKRLTEDRHNSVERLSRPRTASAAGKLQDFSASSNRAPANKSEPTPPLRTKLPDFAALHQKRFAKMESLDECQERRAKRARRLLTPTSAAPDRLGPKDIQTQVPPSQFQTKKIGTPKKSKQPIEKQGYTRFGFKLDLEVNPFSFPAKTEEKQKEQTKQTIKRYATQPSLEGATTARRAAAKQAAMREKSVLEKRDVKRKENRTIIKGVRTNRRFELQMKMRNVDG